MIEVVKNFETVRKQWLHAELELKKYKELLVKSDVAKAALEVKLKHARNQLDVEMKKRYKMEGDYQYLVSQHPWPCPPRPRPDLGSPPDAAAADAAHVRHPGPRQSIQRLPQRPAEVPPGGLRAAGRQRDRTQEQQTVRPPPPTPPLGAALGRLPPNLCFPPPGCR